MTRGVLISEVHFVHCYCNWTTTFNFQIFSRTSRKIAQSQHAPDEEYKENVFLWTAHISVSLTVNPQYNTVILSICQLSIALFPYCQGWDVCENQFLIAFFLLSLDYQLWTAHPLQSTIQYTHTYIHIYIIH